VFAHELFHCPGSNETVPAVNETIFRLQCRTLETAHGYQATNKRTAEIAAKGTPEIVKCAP
jgi:hypothetical protein